MKSAKLLTTLILFVLLGSAFSASHNQAIEIHNGFLTGKTYLDLPKGEREAYAMGLIDGMMLAPLFDAPKAKTSWFESCIVNMTNEQVAAILTKFLKDHPERWHQPAHIAMFAALKESCPSEN